MRQFTLFIASLFVAIGAMAQSVNFTFTRTGTNSATVTTSGSDSEGVTATITASGDYLTAGAMANATNVLCVNTNTNVALESNPITYTLTVSGLSNSTVFNCITHTHKAVNSSGQYQPSNDADVRPRNFIITANDEELGTKTKEGIWIPAGKSDKTIEYSDLEFSADENGNLVIVIKLYSPNETTEEQKGCFFGLTGITISGNPNQLALEELVATATTKYNSISQCIGNTPGYYLQSTVDALQSAIATASTITEATESDVTTLQAAIDAVSVIVPTKGKYYRFKHPSQDAYMLSDEHILDNGNKRLAMGALESNKTTSIFYYCEDGSLLSYANGRFLSDAAQGSASDWACLAVGATAPSATFGKGSANGTLGFYLGTNASRAYYSARTTYVDAGGSFGTNAGYDWVIEEVTELPVSISAAGFATFYTPVALEINENVTCYTAESVDDISVNLTPVTTGVLPAGAAVLLEATEGTYNFAISATAGEAIEGNMFKGTSAKSVITPEGTAYALGIVDEKVGFYLVELDENNNAAFQNQANKAYLLIPATSGARYFALNFGGGTTGIEGVEAEGAVSGKIYDITGREVKAITAPGIYIVNGAKVVVK